MNFKLCMHITERLNAAVKVKGEILHYLTYLEKVNFEFYTYVTSAKNALKK